MADFRFLGAYGSDTRAACDNFDPDYMWWHGTHIESQLAVSEAAANCAAQQLEDSPLGTFFMDEKNLNEFMYLEPGTLKMDTTALAENIRVFEELYGPNVPIAIDLSYRDMKF